MSTKAVIRKTNSAERMRRVRLMLEEFRKQLESKSKNMLGPGGMLASVPIEKEDRDEELLLNLRQRLSWEIKEGMLNRKDHELEIAVLAMAVWFLRLEADKKARIIDAWGV